MQSSRKFNPTGALSGVHQDFLEKYANWNELNSIFLTFDVDWAPDYMIRHVLEILDAFEVTATFFATHTSPLLKEIELSGRHEIGIHPNLLPTSTQGSGIEEILENLTAKFPNSMGNRFHVLGFSYRDLYSIRRANLKYDASTLLYNASHLQPVHHRDIELTFFPYCWEDGIAENSQDVVRVESMRLDVPGLKIINFHPMNIYINGPNSDARLTFVNSVGPLLECQEEVAQSYRKIGTTGAQVALEGLLNRIAQERLATRPLKELYFQFEQCVQ